MVHNKKSIFLENEITFLKRRSQAPNKIDLRHPPPEFFLPQIKYQVCRYYSDMITTLKYNSAEVEETTFVSYCFEVKQKEK